MPTRLRPTVWPGGPVSVPEFRRHEVRVHDNGWVELRGDGHLVAAPPDFYLREWCVPAVQDLDGAVEFIATWGRSTDPDARDIPFVEASEVHEHVSAEQPDPSTPFDTERQRIGSRLGLDAKSARDRLVNAREVMVRARIVNRLAETLTSWRTSGEVPEGYDDYIEEYLNAGLSAFQVRVLLGGPPPEALAWTTAFSIAALQMANDVAAKTPYVHCGNESCGRLFTVQRGRAQYALHRTTGTKYCSHSCAKAQGERERRRRQKEST